MTTDEKIKAIKVLNKSLKAINLHLKETGRLGSDNQTRNNIEFKLKEVVNSLKVD